MSDQYSLSNNQTCTSYQPQYIQTYPQAESVAQSSQQSHLKKSDQFSTTDVYLTLLGLADTFQEAHQYRLCIHCLESILTLKPHDIPIQTNLQIQIKTRINLCRLYLKYTLNTNQYLNAHLEKLMILIQNLNSNDEYKYESTYIVYKIFQKQKEMHLNLKQNTQTEPSQLHSLFNLDFLNKIFETSVQFPYWHLKLLLLIGDILYRERDYTNSAYYLSTGIEFCSKSRMPTYTHILFILSKGMIHLVQQNSADLQTTMQPCAQMIENYKTTNLYQLETLKIMFLILQVAYYLQCGQAKSVRSTLKNLQHYAQSLSSRLENETNEQSLILSENKLENFYWLHKDHLSLLTFVLTITNNLQSGSFDKVDKLIERAFSNIQKMKQNEINFSKQSIYLNSSFITNKMYYLLMETQVRGQLSVGNRTKAVKCLSEMFQLCDKDQRLMNLFKPQLHCLIGLYSLSVNLKDCAINQFNISLKLTKDKDLWLYCLMNLSLCYLDNTVLSPNTPNKTQLLSILDNFTNDRYQTKNVSLTAFISFFKALKFYLNSQYQQAQESLREAILIANSEDLLNISAGSYLFMGHISLLINQLQESFNMLVNGVDLADKMPDLGLKIYGNSLLKYLYSYYNDPREAETGIKLMEADKQNNVEIYEAVKSPYHALTNWNLGTSSNQLLANINKHIHSIQTSQKSNILNSPQNLNQSINQSHHSPSTPITPVTSVTPVTPKTPNQHSLNQNVHSQPVNQYQQQQQQPQQQHQYNQQQQQQQKTPIQQIQQSPNLNSPQHYRVMQQVQHQQQQINISPMNYHNSPTSHQHYKQPYNSHNNNNNQFNYSPQGAHSQHYLNHPQSQQYTNINQQTYNQQQQQQQHHQQQQQLHQHLYQQQQFNNQRHHY